ncbi:major facilitator superfamily domain-containing protein [Macrophomina phaseolina]|uniref:Major facilitator superfamily domain-containing protein n=1 Tax=Macrophomina phaseolina TaxID=35725 RepID=A0ABQ8GP87_9PEZI|nr:major facilitator superfamily domain-containing protein [Macrophomina phaseolina]
MQGAEIEAVADPAATEATPVDAFETSSYAGEPDYPEGGLSAWLVVFGAWCAMIPSMGLLNTIGVLQAWVAEHELKHYSESNVGWIFSTYAFFLYIGGAQIGSVFDRYGAKPLIIPGSIGMVASTMCMSVSKGAYLVLYTCQCPSIVQYAASDKTQPSDPTRPEYYQFLLSFGVLGGLSASLLFTPAVSAVGHWFCKRRALATGIACTAGGSGGIAFPFIILYLAPSIGFAWAMRIIGFINAGMCLCACLLLRTRIPPSPHAGAAIDVRALWRDAPYAATTLAIFLVEFAVFIPLTYVSSYALRAGVAPQHAYRLIALLNVGSVPGRALPGYVADRFGRFNVMIATACVCALVVLALWLPAGASEASITAFAVLFGFWSGAAISLTPVCVAQVCRIEDYGKRNGTTFSLASFAALVGIPVAGAILGAEGAEYTGLIVFGGAMYAAAAAAFVVARAIAGPKSWRALF